MAIARTLILPSQACYNRPMHIQLYRHEDGVEALYGFVREAMASSYGLAYSPAAMAMFEEYHSLQTVERDVTHGHVFAAWEDSVLLGTVTVADGEIGRMLVTQSCRGQGVGRALMETALAQCAGLGWQKITAWAVPWARGFYGRFGFVCVNADVLDFHNTRNVPVPYFEMELRPQLAAVQICAAAADDLDELLHGQRLAFREQCLLYGDWSIPPVTETAQDVQTAMQGGAIVLKAVVDGRIIGGVRGKLVGNTAQVGRLFVLPQAQRGGVARQLMAAIEEALSSCERYELFTGERSLGNLALYQRQGYAPTGRAEDTQASGGTPYRLVWLEKPNPWPHIEECIGRYAAR